MENNIYIELIAQGPDWRPDRADKAAPRPASAELLMTLTWFRSCSASILRSSRVSRSPDPPIPQRYARDLVCPPEFDPTGDKPRSGVSFPPRKRLPAPERRQRGSDLIWGSLRSGCSRVNSAVQPMSQICLGPVVAGCAGNSLTDPPLSIYFMLSSIIFRRLSSAKVLGFFGRFCTFFETRKT